jgi:hypothetical protein
MRQGNVQRSRHACARAAWWAAALSIGCSPNASEEANPNSNAPIVRDDVGPVLCGNGERCGNDPVNENDPTHVTTEGPGTVVFSPDDVSSGGGIRLSDKMDLLFVVDNSVSRGDKQQIFAAAIPDLLARLVNPPCLDSTLLQPPIQLGTPEEKCPVGTARQFAPLKDIHVGIVTSTLGAHGADSPVDGCAETQSDLAHMVGTLERGRLTPSYQDLGFLAWDPEQRVSPPGSTSLQQITQGFVDMLSRVGEAGCGFEAPLEAMYRFLMDPAPPASFQRVPCNVSDPGENCVRPQGIDAALLAQRAAFLRKDSVVAILMIADEDDCSIRDTDIAWWQADKERGMTRGSSACDADPNSPCCYSCSFNTPEGKGCVPREQDPACCPAGPDGTCTAMTPLISPDEERTRLGPNLRCYDQKRKYGYDYLYPVQRYVLGLTSPWLPEGFDEQGRPLVNDQGEIRFAKNPLYSEPVDDNGNVRSKDQVFFVGIVGVPWQDVATPETRDAAGQLDLIPATQFAASGLWERILGSKAEGLLAQDPFARESTVPRSGVNPITQDPILAPDSVTFNAINGKERDVFDDLQFSCIFPLPESRSCANVAQGSACDCQTDKFQGNPLCWDQGTSTYTSTQRFAKAYPAPRILSVLQAVGTQAVVSSICPKDMDDTNARDFGYRPVIGTFVKEAARILIK